jgi:hypothetical protein
MTYKDIYIIAWKAGAIAASLYNLIATDLA